ncbi:uncharacterized protein LOC105420099 [Amborella trichopoda]|uniref:uncharacterized protein LOC105420099 n=1 Tax=Amborella trichopoda TaxID=13333 RepID=UPI0005D3E56C|nr:uncharacterized protein LOC105420099 [Amborella trichopoda]|eukprot:XP_011620661.1 uncharacterized protein LOC105420099 [Amborella trichopoda]
MEFNIKYVPQKAVKGQALADFLTAHPLPIESPLSSDLPDEEVFCVVAAYDWNMYFDGAFQLEQCGASVVYLTPQDGVIPLSFCLAKAVSHNEDEYQAFIIWLEVTLDLKLERLAIFNDFELIIHLKGIYDVRKDSLKPYHDTAKTLMVNLDEFSLGHIPRKLNSQADALAKLGATIQNSSKEPMPIWVAEWTHIELVKELDGDDERILFPKFPPYPFGALLTAKDAFEAERKAQQVLGDKSEKQEGEIFDPICTEI